MSKHPRLSWSRGVPLASLALVALAGGDAAPSEPTSAEYDPTDATQDPIIGGSKATAYAEAQDRLPFAFRLAD